MSDFASSALGGTIGKIKLFGGQTAMAAIVGGTTNAKVFTVAYGKNVRKTVIDKVNK